MLRIDEQLPIKQEASIDALHQEEIALTTELNNAAKNGESQLVLKLLNELIEHTAKHFMHEEELMQNSNYPDLTNHQYEHAKELMDMESILSFYEMTNDNNSIHTYLEDSFTSWVKNHVEMWDIPLSEYLEVTPPTE